MPNDSPHVFPIDATMTQEQIERKIQEMQQKLHPTKAPKQPVTRPLPKASTELWPTGPSVDTGDIRLA